ncbi:MAG TPA: allophanate hydrolase subunit 1 [Actinomycetales bacterium]|nr:allophanate hydrolase subunit 1 [Actinomycetales bacterium]
MTVRVLPYGDAALLVELADLDEVLAFADAVRSATPPEVVDVVPAARTVLVVAEPGADLTSLERSLLDLRPSTSKAGPANADDVLELPVHYDGPDLEEVAAVMELSVEELISLHTGREWQVAFGGFAPGFGYLTRHDFTATIPRREQPRTRVPAGAVGLAGRFSGVYPSASPGGWQLIGRTDAVLWDVDRDPPSLIRPGSWVRFLPVS